MYKNIDKNVEDLKMLSRIYTNNISIVSNVLDNTHFQYWTAADRDTLHHYGAGSLIQHTREVIEIALNNNKLLNLGLSNQQIFLAGLYHDFGKIYEYSCEYYDAHNKRSLIKHSDVFDTIPENVVWIPNSQKEKVYHIVRSAMLWKEACIKYDYNDIDDEILHAILAHHGLREWKSPVLPQTKLAWLIHLSDMTSARLADCGNGH